MTNCDEIENRVASLHATTVVVNTYGGPYTSGNVLRKFLNVFLGKLRVFHKVL